MLIWGCRQVQRIFELTDTARHVEFVTTRDAVRLG
jgi:hypothetical protein